ncbi:hypothetical protein TNCV_2788711 [Trichonephila clavipes]|uniref:Uncharacterized protein n=1 Tax=Trichonephila clavipes TaxID=2585209 RepID=A0A8X6VQ66_TRICX|nr:hypothetical protein TNCV_2788711 [Trichonephila clavipes]
MSACTHDSPRLITSFNSDRLNGRYYTPRNFNLHSQKSTGVRSEDRGGHVNLQRLPMILRLGHPDLSRSSSDPVSSNR